MNIYDAVLKAADHIERNPGEFRFTENVVPDGCGAPGCAIGWAAHFCGLSGFSEPSCAGLFGVSHRGFYDRMDELTRFREVIDYDKSWYRNPAKCAEGLRLYAAKYLTPAKPAQTFDWNALARRLGREPLVVNSESTALRAEAR